MPSVDDRIVAMQFNNTSFEQRITQTLASLEKLKSSLDFANSTKGLEDLNVAGNRFNLDGMASALDNISSKFTAMGAVAFSVINNLVSRVVDAGVQLAKSLTLDPILQGFTEYETNLNSIQTILANTQSDGTNLEQVNAALKQLNEYSDRTIYNFSEMARNIGTFTAAGVDLETSVNAIKGIANLAAISGSTSAQASTAMYQLSQAIAAGSVRLMDWNSVVAAGMGGEVFQRALFETGKAMGTITGVDIATTFDEWTAAGNTFRTSLAGTGEAIESETDKAAKAMAEADEIIADAEESAAERTEASAKRVTDARENVAEVAIDTAERVADAEKAREEAAVQSAERIADAEKAQADVFAATAESITRAVEEQRNAVEQGALDVAKAFDDLVAARKRLDKAMEPTSANDLEAATDNLTSAQLDQADLATAIEDAQRDQARAAEDLTKAQQNLTAVEQDSTSTAEEIAAARRKVEDAERRVLDLADAVERARLRQNAAARDLVDAEEALAEAKEKGTAADENVIDAQKDLEEATKNYADTQREAAEREQAAAEELARVQEEANERQLEAAENLAKAHQNAAESAEDANKRVADAVEDSSERQLKASEQVADAEKKNAKTIEEAQESVATAHEKAAKKMEEFAAAGGPPTWLTSEVLTTTLSAFTGDLDAAQLKSLGYTEEQAAELVKLGKLGNDAATQVKTLTQLLGTVKESIGSGWAQSFQIIFGDFEEAKSLWTETSETLKGLTDASAAARNALLDGWKDLGGRTALIEGMKNVFEALASVLKPIKEAFREIFPPVTAQQLFELTERFRDFTEKLTISGGTADTLKTIFKGLFAALDIGWMVVKGIAGVFGDLFNALAPLGSGMLDVVAGIAQAFTDLRDSLKNGEGFGDFFASLSKTVTDPIPGLLELRDKIFEFFGSLDFDFSSGILSGIAEGFKKIFNIFAKADPQFTNSMEGGFERLGNILDWFRGILKTAGNIFEWFWDKAVSLKKFAGNAIESLMQTLSELGPTLSKALKSEEFDKILESVQTLLLGIAALGVGKLGTNGLDINANLDFTGGLLSSLAETAKGMTGTLGALTQNIQTLTTHIKAMTLEIQSQAILKIAAAIAILTASAVVLASIDPVKLTAAMTAIAVGFGQLSATAAVLVKLSSGIGGAAGFGLLAGGLVLLAGSMLILSFAAKNLSGLNWEEISVGLTGITGLLGTMVVVVKPLSSNSGGLIAAGLGMIAMAFALNILALAVKQLADLEPEEMAQGLAGLAAIMTIFALTAEKFSKNSDGMISAGIGMIAMALGLKLMAGAVEAFAEIEFEDMAKGMANLGSALLVIAGAMHVMPDGLALQGAGLLFLSVGLLAMAAAVKAFGNMDWDELKHGLVGLGATLGILAGALYLMSGTIGGSIAIGIAATSLLILVKVLKQFAGLSWDELIHGLAGIGITLGAFAAAAALLSGAIPVMLGLGAALLLLGAGFALIGIGAKALAESMKILAETGSEGVEIFKKSLEVIVKMIPSFIASFADGLIQMAQAILEALPGLLVALQGVLQQLLQMIIDIMPQLGEALSALVALVVTVIRDNLGDIVKMGLELIMALIQGIRDNIGEVTAAVIDIIVRFVDAIAERVDDVIEAGVNLLAKLLQGIADNLDDVIEGAIGVLAAFLAAFSGPEGLAAIVTAAADLIINLATSIAANTWRIIDTAADLLIDFLHKLAEKIPEIADETLKFIINVMNGISDAIENNQQELQDAGRRLAFNILNGLTLGFAENILNVIDSVVGFFRDLWNAVLNFFGVHSPSVLAQNLAVDIVQGLINGFWNNLKVVKDSIVDFFESIWNGVLNFFGWAKDGAVLGWNLAVGIVKGLANGFWGWLDWIVDQVIDFFGSVWDSVLGFFGIRSPSRLAMDAGNNLVEGFAIGVEENDSAVNSVQNMSRNVADAMRKTLAEIPDALDDELDFNPTITPVLDLTKVKQEGANIDGIFAGAQGVSFGGVTNDQAAVLTALQNRASEESVSNTGEPAVRDIKFEQNIIATTPLSIGEVYRQTKNQITMAKEELNVP